MGETKLDRISQRRQIFDIRHLKSEIGDPSVFEGKISIFGDFMVFFENDFICLCIDVIPIFHIRRYARPCVSTTPHFAHWRFCNC
jgi:hypothetical protein